MGSKIEAKKAIVEKVTAAVAKAEAIVIAEYRGVSVANLTKLRLQAREKNVFLKVLKNTLARRSVEGTAFANLSEKMIGPALYAISSDPIVLAKVLCQFASREEAFVVKAGSYKGQLLTEKEITVFSAIPSQQELLAKLLAVFQSPIAGLARVLAGIATQKETQQTA